MLSNYDYLIVTVLWELSNFILVYNIYGEFPGKLVISTPAIVSVTNCVESKIGVAYNSASANILTNLWIVLLLKYANIYLLPSTAISNVLPSKSNALVSNTLCRQIWETTPGS